MSATGMFADREEAGRALAAMLAPRLAGDVVVLALPRGGVPVAAPVARALGAPLDVLVVRKVGVPGHEERALGALASGGVVVVDDEVAWRLGLSEDELEALVARQVGELERRERVYRGERPPVDVRGRTVVLVDDGIATGSTMAAAAQAVRERGGARVVVAAPVGAPTGCRALGEHADEVVCLRTPPHFRAVGDWYADFRPVADEQVQRLLAAGGGDQAPAATATR